MWNLRSLFVAILIAGALGWSCTGEKTAEPDAVVPQKPTPEVDPFERSLEASGYSDLTPMEKPPHDVLGPIIAELASIRGATGKLNQQIGAVRDTEIEFGGRARSIEAIYSATRDKRIVLIFRTDEIVFYFADVSDLSESMGNRFFLVTETAASGERAEFVVK